MSFVNPTHALNLSGATFKTKTNFIDMDCCSKHFPKISIIVPIYNVEKYLHQCLDSIINQTLENIEIICINDGSKDSSLSILQEYANKDNRIVIIDKENSGYGHTMNRGLEKATGEYVGIVESDDWIESDMFEKLYQIAKQNNAEVVKSNFYYYWSTPNEKNIKSDVIPASDLNKIINPLEHQNIFWSMPCIWAAIYKRDFLQTHQIDFLETPGASYQDTAFNFKIWATAKRVFLIEDAFLHYRQDNEQSSVNSKSKTFCVCDEYHEVERFVDKNDLFALRKLAQRLKYNVYIWNFSRLTFPLNWQFLKTMSQEFKQAQEENLIDRSFFEKFNYKRLKRIIKHPLLFLLKAQFKKLKQSIKKNDPQ